MTPHLLHWTWNSHENTDELLNKIKKKKTCSNLTFQINDSKNLIYLSFWKRTCFESGSFLLFVTFKACQSEFFTASYAGHMLYNFPSYFKVADESSKVVIKLFASCWRRSLVVWCTVVVKLFPEGVFCLSWRYDSVARYTIIIVFIR